MPILGLAIAKIGIMGEGVGETGGMKDEGARQLNFVLGDGFRLAKQEDPFLLRESKAEVCLPDFQGIPLF